MAIGSFVMKSFEVTRDLTGPEPLIRILSNDPIVGFVKSVRLREALALQEDLNAAIQQTRRENLADMVLHEINEMEPLGARQCEILRVKFIRLLECM
jgi:hypothetical protein